MKKMITTIAAVVSLALVGLALSPAASAQTMPGRGGSFASVAAFAENACNTQAVDKKLAGAALTSFLTKCCSGEAEAQKLQGAALTSFVNKCVSDTGP